MTRDLSFTSVVYGLGAGLFFLGYATLQIPANMIAAKLGIVRVMVTLMFCWGLTSLLMGAISNEYQFYILRTLLGVFEAGITPVTLLFITIWFTVERRGSAFSRFVVAMPCAGALGGPVSAMILEYMNNFAGWAGWRWLFVLEAIPTIVLAFVCMKLLAGSPAEAKWLTADESSYLRQSAEISPKIDSTAAASDKRSMYRPRFAWQVFLLSSTWATFTASYVGLFFWMPAILSRVFEVPSLAVGWYVGGLYVSLAIALLLCGRIMDKVRWVRELMLIVLVVFASSLFLAGIAKSLLAVLIFFFIAMTLVGVGMSAFWTVTLREFDHNEAPLGIGIVNCSGSAGAFAMLYLYGYVAEAMSNIQTGLFALAFGGGLAILSVLCWYREKLGKSYVQVQVS